MMTVPDPFLCNTRRQARGPAQLRLALMTNPTPGFIFSGIDGTAGRERRFLAVRDA